MVQRGPELSDLVRPANPGHQPDEPGHVFNSAYDGLLGPKSSPARVAEASKVQDTAKVQEVQNTPEKHEADIKRAAEDLKAGKWSDQTAQAFRDLYTELSQQPGATPGSVFQGLQQFGVKINQEAEKLGTENRINLAGVQSGNRIGFWYVATGPGINPNQALGDIQADRDGPTAVLAGQIVVMRKPGQPI